ncbi:hypothetical protein [Streptomyces sp. ISL-86]|uniref:hypothetical protein n=1 Tax=Streptomyces sp. ISL-86 TaxID=2819187 RepID=UPI001BE62538|nr:hypothetical protein [Streptomyces sp. ISL-86]MBT2454889.1 hypothetical protein [Streptomyces sp. ISL-86]
MAPQREIYLDTAGGRLAAFLVDLTSDTSVRKLAARFGRSSSSWGNYLNGSKLIPKQLVGRLVESFTPHGPARNTKALRALELWNAADAERRAASSPSGAGELVRQHQRRDDALQQVIKYQALAANADKHLAELRPMLAYTQSRLENAELQLKLGGVRERARVERLLGQARERLGRVRIQQERARGRRMTAEEHQEFWMAEVLRAQEEISRLEHEAQDLVVVPAALLEPVDRDATDAVDDDSDFEARLEHITAEGLEDEALIEEDLQQGPNERDSAAEPHVPAVQGHPVQPLSNPVLDKLATGYEVLRRTRIYRATRSLLAASFETLILSVCAVQSTLEFHPGYLFAALEAAAKRNPTAQRYRRAKQVLIRIGLTDALWYETEARRSILQRRFLLPFPLLLISWLSYVFCQPTPQRPSDKGIGFWIAAATLVCLPILYGSLRAVSVPKVPARITAVLLHTTWAVLFVLDRLPWSP